MAARTSHPAGAITALASHPSPAPSLTARAGRGGTRFPAVARPLARSAEVALPLPPPLLLLLRDPGPNFLPSLPLRKKTGPRPRRPAASWRSSFPSPVGGVSRLPSHGRPRSGVGPCGGNLAGAGARKEPPAEASAGKGRPEPGQAAVVVVTLLVVVVVVPGQEAEPACEGPRERRDHGRRQPPPLPPGPSARPPSRAALKMEEEARAPPPPSEETRGLKEERVGPRSPSPCNSEAAEAEEGLQRTPR